jgi:hypothetical protein
LPFYEEKESTQYASEIHCHFGHGNTHPNLPRQEPDEQHGDKSGQSIEKALYHKEKNKQLNKMKEEACNLKGEDKVFCHMDKHPCDPEMGGKPMYRTKLKRL